MGRWTDIQDVSSFDEQEDTREQNYQPQEEPAQEQPQAPQGNEYYYTDQQQPEAQEVQPSRAWDTHYSPSWFIEEQANRKNPLYEKDESWSDQEVDAIANYVTGKKNAMPQNWKYGDPGWDTEDELWNNTIKPREEEYEAAQKKAQAVQMQEQPQQEQPQQRPQYYAFHNNQMMTTDLAIRQEGNNLAPVRTQTEIDRIKANSPYQLHNVDKSNADYESLSRSGKTWYNVMPSTAGTDVKNRKWYQRYTQPVLGAVMSASGPATIAKLLVTAFGGPAGLVYGAVWGASVGYSYLKGTGTIQGNKYIDKFMELTDILDEKGAQAQGALAYGFEKAGGGDLTDWSKFGDNLNFLVDNFDTIMHYAFGEGKASSEYNKDVVGIVTGLTPNMGANAIGIEGLGVSRFVRSATSQLLDNPEDRVWLERNQTTRSNIGKEGVYEIPEELLGTNAITYWLNYGQYLYDNGVTNPQQLELEISTAMADVYGDLFNASEFIEHEIGDPGNITENMQSRAMYGYAKITGDENLATAAKDNTNSLIGDLTGNIPVIPDVMRFFAKLAGNNEFLKTSGGIDEIINTWDMENLRSTDPSRLTARDRRLSGINPDGSLKSMDTLVDPNTIKNPFARGAEKIKQLFQTTPEWRASMSGDAIMNFISTGIEDALSARPEESADARIKRVMTFVDELEHPETISDKSPFSRSSKTILFNSIKDDLSMAVRSHRAQIDKVITDYANLEPNRQVLNQLAEALRLTPEKVMDKYQNEKTVLAQMIINKADQNNGTIPSITFADGTPIPVDSKEFGDRVISMISPFAGDNAKAYDPRLLMTQITSAISDGVTETLINKYNIQEEGWVYRFGDTVKKLQHLWLLGLSPSYLANNFVNNILTRSALGYGGFLTGKTINNWMGRFGWTPERFSESMAEGVLGGKDSKTSAEKMRAAIREKRKGGNKFFDKVDKKLDWVSEHAGFFGAISGKVEELESRQIYASAMMTYMARTWKPGVNFRKMDPQLENLINEQSPGMVDAIYSAISGGVSMKEIENAIYGTYVIPNIQDTLVEAAQAAGIVGAEDAIVELFRKGGIFEELQDSLNGKRGDEIDAVIDRIIKRAEAIANIQLAEDLMARAEQVANDTNGYGFAEAIQVGQDMADQMADVWIKSQDANTQLFNRRIREDLRGEAFRKLYLDHQKVLNERWAGVYATVQQNYLGILNGLGFTDETTKTYVDTMQQKNGLWTTFYQKAQPEAIQPYLDSLVWQKDDTFETWDSRVRKAWADYLKDINKKYNDTVEAEQKLQIQMDKTFADGLRASLNDTNKPKVKSIIEPLQKQIRDKRQEIVNKNKELRAIADNTPVLNEKNLVYIEAQAERKQLVEDYKNLQKDLYKAIRDLGPSTVSPAHDSATATPNPAADIRADAAQRRAEKMRDKAAEFSEKVTDKIIEDEEIPDINDGYETVTEKEPDNTVHLTSEEVGENLVQGIPTPLSDTNLAEDLGEIDQSYKNPKIEAVAQFLYDSEIADPRYARENAREHFTLDDYIAYVNSLVNPNAESSLTEETKARMFANLSKYDETGSVRGRIEDLKNNFFRSRFNDIPETGDYVIQTYAFSFGANTIVGAVFHNGKLVAYVPQGMALTSVDIDGNDSVRVLGVDPEHPDQWVYQDEDEVHTARKQEVKKENPKTGDAEVDSLGALDPAGQANHEMTYEQVVPILLEFKNLYKRALNDAMASKTFGSLDGKTKELVRQYIDNDIRSDLMNTKYKTGKFGEMMRDAALLNYSKRYGFDNALTLLFPYQFWQTRSAWNWIQRMGGKGGKMWRRYARLKELEERNKKELMPSRITGKVGIYLPFLPDWMGDALFMPTSQLSIVGNFMDPLDDWLTDNKAVNATAERYVQEAFEANDISLQEYRDAMDPAKRNGSAVWQEMYARAQANGDHDRDLGTLFKQYFGMSLPVSVGKALMENNPEGFTQLPMSRAGTAFRAMFGDNIVGKGLEFAMSAPERALRKAAVAITGNNDFRYQEFGNWGDYYIRNQVWDMVVEGRISPEQAITAQEEKDGNKIWDEAAERQRMELLQKTQILSATMPFKKAVEDIKTGNQDKLGDDIKYLFAEILTMWTPTSVVRSAERTWREDKAEMSKLYDTNDKNGQQKFYDDHKYYSYNNLRYEDNPEQALRSYLYKSINDTWYDLSKSEQDELKLALGTDFQRSILDKETRAYQTMDLTRLAAYAQALNGSIPFLATDSLNTTNVPKINTNVVPMSEKVSREIFFKERERLYPGMADVSNIYYQLPVEDRKYFRQANPNLDKYWAWKKQYETDYPEVKNFSKRMSDYYDTLNAENVCSQLDEFTIKELNRAAYAKRKVDKIYEPIIIRAMYSAGVTDDYDSFVKVLTNYILGE